MKSSILLLPICAALLAFVSASSNPLQEEVVAISGPIMAPVQVEGSDDEIQRPKRQGILGALLHGLAHATGDHHHHHGGNYGGYGGYGGGYGGYGGYPNYYGGHYGGHGHGHHHHHNGHIDYYHRK